MTIQKKRGVVAAVVGTLIASTAIFGISTQEAQAAAQNAAVTKALNTPTTLTFWSWLPGQQNEVNLFEATYPKIKVKLVNVGSGGAEYNKIKAGLAAKSGLPDVAQIEFQYVPTFKVLGGLANIAPYVGGAAWLKQFPAWISAQVTDSKGGIYAVPQDSGPMGLLYRSDVFAKDGITPPKTWAEFATDAAKIHAADSTQYISNMVMDSGNMNGLYWQAGARPFHLISNTQINIHLNDAATKQVTKFWGDLVASGNLPVDPYWTADWNAAFNKGKYVSWPAAAWGLATVSAAAADTSGNWRAAPLPTWGGSPVSGNWGGSTSAVLSTSKNVAAAAAFASFINTNSTASFALTQAPTFDFPVSNSVLSSAGFKATAPAFYGGQKVYQSYSAYNATVGKNYEWSPFQDEVYTLWTNDVLAAILKNGDTSAAVDKWQADTVKYAKDQGYTVTTK